MFRLALLPQIVHRRIIEIANSERSTGDAPASINVVLSSSGVNHVIILR